MNAEPKCERRKGERRKKACFHCYHLADGEDDCCLCGEPTFPNRKEDRRAKPQEPSADAELARRVEEIRQYWTEAEKYRVRPQDISQGEHPNLHVDQLRDLFTAIDAAAKREKIAVEALEWIRNLDPSNSVFVFHAKRKASEALAAMKEERGQAE